LLTNLEANTENKNCLQIWTQIGSKGGSLPNFISDFQIWKQIRKIRIAYKFGVKSPTEIKEKKLIPQKHRSASRFRDQKISRLNAAFTIPSSHLLLQKRIKFVSWREIEYTSLVSLRLLN